MLSEKEKEELLKIARNTLEIYLKEKRVPQFDVCYEKLLDSGGAFVTLHEGDQLRGCIGLFEAPDPLYQVVQKMAMAAATEDPRFNPVHLSELGQINIEISVLSPRKSIAHLSEIQVGTHGLCVARGFRKGVLLPQVATENHWNREEFLSHTCLKAGLPADAWEKGDLKIEIFCAEVFGEEK